MPDYKAVLRKTITGLADNTEEIRAKVYERARTTIRKQLDAVTPALPIERITKETDSLEEAIREVEREYIQSATAQIEPDVETSALQTELNKAESSQPVPPEVSPSGKSMKSPSTDDNLGAMPTPSPVVSTTKVKQSQAQNAAQKSKPKKRRKGWLVLLILLLIGGGAVYAGSQYKEEITERLGSYAKALNLPFPSKQTDEGKIKSEADSPIAPEVQEPVESTQESTFDPKFNERLGSNGQTISSPSTASDIGDKARSEDKDVLPRDDVVEEIVIVDEDNSDAIQQPTQVQTPETPSNSQDVAKDTDQENSTDTNQADNQPRVAQRSFFYVESKPGQETSRTTGSASWRNGLSEGLPTIETEVELPDLGMKVSMIIRKNTDETFSASHVIELLFTVPENFSGGRIDTVRQVVLKDTEEAQGNALIAEPAKISDGFFLIALYDLPEARTANELILQERDWIDIPVAFVTGRRALLTLEKGAKGNSVFRTAFAAWARQSG